MKILTKNDINKYEDNELFICTTELEKELTKKINSYRDSAKQSRINGFNSAELYNTGKKNAIVIFTNKLIADIGSTKKIQQHYLNKQYNNNKIADNTDNNSDDI